MKTKTYAGIPEQYSILENAEIVLIPVPYDGTSTWQKGADKGPIAFLNASENMELFDIETQSEVYKKGVYLAEAITENRSPKLMVEAVGRACKKYLDEGKFVTLFGGEHSISIGSIRSFADQYSDLTVLQLDAHADLRPTYEGSAFNHACAMHEASTRTNLVQVGIRSMDYSELTYMDQGSVFYAHEIHSNPNWQELALQKLTGNVFITIDLDVFDPSIVPSTGTPEPGGLQWYETLAFLRKVCAQRNVVGFDIVELCPNTVDRSSDFLAAKLYYKLLSYKFESK